ncbi:MAG TPA: hypothetical protein VGG72_20220 [Bryobacteraceae bacterium]|jgi:hypothetical protein
MADETDYLRFYDDEGYLLDVGKSFRETGNIEPADFYMLLIWKANRAKNRHRDRLKRLADGSFRTAVSQIASALHATADRKHRLQMLMKKWEFALPTATAILTILYPDEFTVYDYRVCEEVRLPYTPQASFSDDLWHRYEQFQAAVVDATPKQLTKLRDRDRFLIGRSFRKQLEADCMD